MIRYNLIWEQPAVLFHRQQISALLYGEAAAYYCCPLFFSSKELGYVMLRFDHPDAFDPIFRNLLKAISNGLEFLRMKNDIRYLTECQNLSEQRDMLTGMYNETGLKKHLHAAIWMKNTLCGSSLPKPE